MTKNLCLFILLVISTGCSTFHSNKEVTLTPKREIASERGGSVSTEQLWNAIRETMNVRPVSNKIDMFYKGSTVLTTSTGPEVGHCTMQFFDNTGLSDLSANDSQIMIEVRVPRQSNKQSFNPDDFNHTILGLYLRNERVYQGIAQNGLVDITYNYDGENHLKIYTDLNDSESGVNILVEKKRGFMNKTSLRCKYLKLSK